MKFTPGQMRKLDELDWWTKLEQIGFSRKDLLRRDLMDSTDSGETIRMTSAYSAAAEYLDSKRQKVGKTDEMDSKIIGGNERLVESLACAIGRENIYTKCEVTRIIHEKGKVTLHRKGHPPISADSCICAIPAHTLWRIDWGTQPPEHKLEAAKELQYARITKTAVLCSHRFWPKPAKGGFSVCTSLASDFCFDSTQGQTGSKGILCSYAVGDKADDIASAPPEKLKYWIVEDVANAFGLHWNERKSKKTAVAIKQQPWQEDRFTGGAYAFFRPGQWFKLRPPLSKPFKNVFFAGEHIADWQGFMEGAVVTGKAAADAVLRDRPNF